MKHGVFASQQATSVSVPVKSESGLPYVVGIAPVQSASKPAAAGAPVLITAWDEAVEKLGYSDDWEKYSICEFMYSHFKLYGCQPVVFYNMLDAENMKAAVEAADKAVVSHKVSLPIDTINDDTLVVSREGAVLVKGVDYETYYNGEALEVELLEDSAYYAATVLNISCSVVDTGAITAADVAAAIDGVDFCTTMLGITPDLMVAPGYSHDAVNAALMATKMGSIDGLFSGKALIDIDCSASGATDYSMVMAEKTKINAVDPAQVLCWPMCTLGEKKFHLSTQLAGLMASVDYDNDGIPYESPSNKGLKIDGICLADGTPVKLKHSQATYLNGIGIVTALNFMGGWTAFGNYTACYPSNTDVKDHFIPISRMFSWVGNTLIKTFWYKLDDPMNTLLKDSIVDSCNIWLNGLTGRYLLGARVEIRDDENPLTDLMAGIIRIHVYMTPPSPAQEIDFILEYDADYVTAALTA